MRDLRGSPRTLAAASATLEARADRANALHARLIAVRRLLLLGRLDEAASALARLDARGLPPSLLAVAELAAAEVALRSLRTAAGAGGARARPRCGRTRARARARWPRWPRRAPRSIAPPPGASTTATSSRCASTRWKRCSPRARWWSTPAVTACAPAPPGDRWRAGRCCSRWRARSPRHGPATSIATRLIARAFRTRRPDETHRARLRVEIGRLRALAAPLARIEASARGFALTPRGERAVVVLVPPIDGDQASLLALLADGAAWSTSALALALGASQRTVQRALVELEAAGRVRSIGRARAQRWLAPPLTGFTTNLLLPAALPLG